MASDGVDRYLKTIDCAERCRTRVAAHNKKECMRRCRIQKQNVRARKKQNKNKPSIKSKKEPPVMKPENKPPAVVEDPNEVGEVEIFESRVRDTLKRREIFVDGDDLDVKLNNVVIEVGSIQFKTGSKHIGMPKLIGAFTTVSNPSKEKASVFSIDSKGDFLRSFSSVISLGLGWRKNRIRGRTKITPSGNNKDLVTFPLDTSAPYATNDNLAIPFQFTNMNVLPRSKAETKGHFQTLHYTAPFEATIRITAKGPVKSILTRDNIDTIILLSLHDAVEPGHCCGFKTGVVSDK